MYVSVYVEANGVSDRQAYKEKEMDVEEEMISGEDRGRG